jgi:hypothetical protein
MSWSLRVSNGDLVLDGSSFGTVTNENKLVQDFRHHLLEHMGHDIDHPWYGSLIDGGTKPNGQEVESVISETYWPAVTLRIESEIRRIASVYQRQQLKRAEADRIRYNRSTLAFGEILAAVTDVTFSQNADALFVTVVIQSGRGNPAIVDLTLPPVITR